MTTKTQGCSWLMIGAVIGRVKAGDAENHRVQQTDIN